MSPKVTVARAARIIRDGGIVAFPTETVYGLGANALDGAAVRRIFAAKGRPADNPILVHISDEAMLRKVVARVPSQARRLMRRFWPGPLTILFPRRVSVPDVVTAGLPTVGVRMPSHPVALDLIRRAGVPIAAPSANRSGRPSPTSAAHVSEDLPHVPVVDGGTCEHGLESTVVSLDGAPRVLRLGAITNEELREVLPGIRIARPSRRPASPGMKYRHYAPDKPLRLFLPSQRNAMVAHVKRTPGAIALCPSRYAPLFPKGRVIALGHSIDDVARNLFSALRTERGTSLAVLGVGRRGKGRAVMERLERAAENTS